MDVAITQMDEEEAARTSIGVHMGGTNLLTWSTTTTTITTTDASPAPIIITTTITTTTNMIGFRFKGCRRIDGYCLNWVTWK